MDNDQEFPDYDPKVPRFVAGDVLQLRSGGPLLTCTSVGGTGYAHFMYFNTVTGLFETHSVDQRCLRFATTAPREPNNAERMRGQTVARSSLT